jgi:hypothetical protein
MKEATPGFVSLSRYYAFILALLVLVTGCTEKRENLVGIDLIDPDDLGEGPLEVVLYAVQDTRFEEVKNTGSSSELYVGSEGWTKMRSLLRFKNLPQADSVVSATITLRRSSFNPSSTFDIIAYPLLTDWTELEVTWKMATEDSLDVPVPWNRPEGGGDFEHKGAGRFTFSAEDEDTLFELDIDTRVVMGWIDESRENHGLILLSSMEGSDFALAPFVSRQSQDGIGRPVIKIEYFNEEEADTLLTVDILVTNDAFIYLYDSPFNGESPTLGDVPAFKTMLKFDLADFDSTWTIIRAELHLHVIDSTYLHDDLKVDAHAVLSSWRGLKTKYDVLPLAGSVISPGDSTLELNLTGITLLWIMGNVENEGVFLKKSGIANTFGYIDTYRADSAMTGKRPSLHIIYHKPGGPPFGDGGIEEKKETATYER